MFGKKITQSEIYCKKKKLYLHSKLFIIRIKLSKRQIKTFFLIFLQDFEDDTIFNQINQFPRQSPLIVDRKAHN